jgi:hypothetical protein
VRAGRQGRLPDGRRHRLVSREPAPTRNGRAHGPARFVVSSTPGPSPSDSTEAGAPERRSPWRCRREGLAP